ncbi:MAG TPA: hypothetical protein VHR66_12790 [Gemmataceae bacterium]|jgi:hypothetical protein|nr:hypothetical protein [Gemmataceae bacterium]
MRLLCPFCQKPITIADSEAGNYVPCPECQKQFAAPQLYTPAPAPLPELAPTRIAPAEPPPLTPPTPAPVPETYFKETPTTSTTDLPHLPPPDREMSGYEHMASVPLDPRVIRIIPAAAIFLALILTVFPWNGLYPAGYSAYTQSAWGCLFAGLSYDDVSEDQMKMKDDLKKDLHSSWFLLPYLVLLFPTLLLAVAGPVVDLAKIKLPPSIEKLWQFRPALLGVLTILTLLFLLAQWARGFGLQRAIDDKITEEFKEKMAQANTPEKIQSVEMLADKLKGQFHVKSTPWLRLAVLMHLLAAGAVVTEAGLMLRGKKKPPRVGVMW